MEGILKADTIWSALEQAAAGQPEKAGYIYGSQEIGFKEMDALSDRMAAGLQKLGIQKGDAIGIICLNQPEWLYTYFAAAKLGARVVTLSARYRESELESIINHSQAKVLVCLTESADMNYVAFLSDFRSKVPSVETYIFIGGKGFEGSYSLADLLDTEINRESLDRAKAEVGPEDLMMILYTSGTTGRPKGAGITHRSQLAAARAQAEHIRATKADVIPLALPFNHIGGATCGILTALLAMAACILIPVFDPDEFIRQSNKYQATLMPGVPTMYTLLLLNENLGGWDTRAMRLFITGGSNADPNLLSRMLRAFPNATMMNLYGLSESSGAVVMTPWDCDFETLLRSIGKVIGDTRVKIVDDLNNDVPVGETGELCFKGSSIIPDYYQMPGETEESFDWDGWLHTGDLGRMDENGLITLMGRKKEVFVQGGFNVYPVEVENLIAKHPKVSMVAGIGVADSILGQIGRYYIVPYPGETLTEEEIMAYCKKHLADYKIPKQIAFRKTLPLSPVGKVMKTVLKEEFGKGERVNA